MCRTLSRFAAARKARTLFHRQPAQTNRSNFALVVIALAFIAAIGDYRFAKAQTQQFWTGASDSNWTNGLNWSGGVKPLRTDLAAFSGAGNGNTTVKINSTVVFEAGASPAGILFDSPDAAAYTIGGPNPGDGGFFFSNEFSNVITVGPSVTTSQIINADIGVNRKLLITNDSTAPGQSLTLAGIVSASAAAYQGDYPLRISGKGHTVITGIITSGSFGGTSLIHSGGGTLTLSSGTKSFYNITSDGNLEINARTFAADLSLTGDTFLNNTLSWAGSPSTALDVHGAGTIHGGVSGKVMYTGTGVNHVYANPYDSLNIDAELTGNNVAVAFGGANQTASTVVLSHANTYTGTTTIQTGTVSVSNIGDAGSPGNLGAGSTIALSPTANADTNTNSKLLYTGSGETNNRAITFSTGTLQEAIIEQAGTGLLKFTGGVANSTSSTAALTLQGSTSGNGELAGSITDGMAGISGIIKQGTNMWTLSGINSYTGPTTVGNGTLALNYDTNDNSKLSNTAALTLGTATLALVGANGTHSEIVGSTTVAGNASITRTGGNTATIQLAAINRSVGGMLNLSADSIATTNTLNTSGILQGVLVGGKFAKNATNAAGGAIVTVADGDYTNVNRMGGTIPSSSSALVRIVDGGSSGNVSLATSGTTSVAALQQTATSGPVTINVGAGNELNFSAGMIHLPPNGSSMTVNGGKLSSAAELLVDNESTQSTITINSAIGDLNNITKAVGKTGPGTLVLTGANTYAGDTQITQGVLSVSTLAAKGTASPIGTGSSGKLVLDGGTFRYTGSGGTLDHDITIGDPGYASTGTIDSSGTGPLVVSGSTLSYPSNNNRYTLELTGSNTAPNFMSKSILGGSATINLLKTGSNTWVLGATKVYEINTHVAEGTLRIDSPIFDSISNSRPVIVDAGATLQLNDTVGCPILGAGSVVTTASGTIGVAGTFSGGLFINSGTVYCATTLGTGTVTFGNLAVLDIRTYSIATGLLASDPVTSATVTGSGTLSSLLIKGNDTQSFSGSISGTMSLKKDGPGTQILAGACTYTGGTNVVNGTLQIGSGGTTGSISNGTTAVPIIVQSGATLKFNRSDNYALGPIAGGGSIVQAGSGILSPTFANNFAGDVFITAGTLALTASDRIANSSNLALGAGTLNASGFSEQMAGLKLIIGSAAATPSVIDFGLGSTNSTLRFASSSDLNNTWSSGSLLQIKNWDQSGHSDHIFIGANPAGQTNSGLSHAQLNSIQFIFSDLSVHTASLGPGGELLPDLAPPPLLATGDIDGNSLFNNGDLSALMQCLADPSTYQQAHGFTPADLMLATDINRDGLLNNADLQAEISFLINGVLPSPPPEAPTSVPEPSGHGMMGIALLGSLFISIRVQRRLQATVG